MKRTAKKFPLPAGFLLVILTPAILWAQVHVVGGLSRRMELSPGSEVQGRVVVRNPSDHKQVMRAYLTGYQTSVDGTTDYKDPEAAQRSNASWIHLVPSRQEVPPGGVASFHYIVRVPEDETLAGTYWSMLMLEPVSPRELEPPEPVTDRRLVIRTVARTGIHMITHIGDTGERDLRFLDEPVLEVRDERVNLLMDIKNTGERLLNLTVWAELFDTQGASIGRFDAGRQNLYPGNSRRMRVNLAGVPPGRYQVLIIFDNGDEHVFGYRHELDISE